MKSSWISRSHCVNVELDGDNKFVLLPSITDDFFMEWDEDDDDDDDDEDDEEDDDEEEDEEEEEDDDELLLYKNNCNVELRLFIRLGN